MQYDKNPILLSSMATIQYVPCNSFCHWEGHRKIEPKAKHFSHGKNNQSSRPNQTDNSKRLAKISNHAYKNSEKNQILFIDNLDHKPTIHRISTNTPKKEFTLNRSPQERGGEHCIEIQKERKSHLANNYGPEGLR